MNSEVAVAKKPAHEKSKVEQKFWRQVVQLWEVTESPVDSMRMMAPKWPSLVG